MKSSHRPFLVSSPARLPQPFAELRNEVDTADTTDFAAKPPLALTIVTLGAFHFLCCGVPLLLLSGFSLATLLPSWPVAISIAAAGTLILIVRHFRKSCANCPQGIWQRWTALRSASCEPASLTGFKSDKHGSNA